MIIEVNKATHARLVKYSAHLGLSANLVVNEALNEWLDEWDDPLDVVKHAPNGPKGSKRRLGPALIINANVLCIDSSVRFTPGEPETSAPNVAIIDLLSVQ